MKTKTLLSILLTLPMIAQSLEEPRKVLNFKVNPSISQSDKFRWELYQSTNDQYKRNTNCNKIPPVLIKKVVQDNEELHKYITKGSPNTNKKYWEKQIYTILVNAKKKKEKRKVPLEEIREYEETANKALHNGRLIALDLPSRNTRRTKERKPNYIHNRCIYNIGSTINNHLSGYPLPTRVGNNTYLSDLSSK